VIYNFIDWNIIFVGMNLWAFPCYSVETSVCRLQRGSLSVHALWCG